MFNFNTAKELLDERIDSLMSDVYYCVLLNGEAEDLSAPYPALLYCFAIIDLLGSFYTGIFNQNADTRNAKKYMKDFMGYSDEEVELLQKIFRHKLVHTAEPKLFYKKGDKIYSWEYKHNNRSKHLSLSTLNKHANTFSFCVSIWSLAKDIKNSVYRSPGGYLDRLNKEKRLQDNFSEVLMKLDGTS